MMAWREPFQVSFRVAEIENGVRVLIGVLAVGDFDPPCLEEEDIRLFLLKKLFQNGTKMQWNWVKIESSMLGLGFSLLLRITSS